MKKGHWMWGAPRAAGLLAALALGGCGASHPAAPATYGANGGAVARGTVQFLQAARGGGVLSLDAATMNPNIDSSGTLRGTIPFTACR